MGWADVAKAAMEKAISAYEASVKVSEQLINIRDRLRDYEDRSERKLMDFEARLRDMESKSARIEGRVDGALAEAFRLAILAPENRGAVRALGSSVPAASDNGSTGSDPTQS